MQLMMRQNSLLVWKWKYVSSKQWTQKIWKQWTNCLWRRKGKKFGCFWQGPVVELFNTQQNPFTGTKKTRKAKNSCYILIHRIFPDHIGPTRKKTTLDTAIKDNNSLLMPIFWANTLSCHKPPQWSLHFARPFQCSSPVNTSRLITPNPSASTSNNNHPNIIPRSWETRTLRIFPREWYGKQIFEHWKKKFPSIFFNTLFCE